DGVPRRNVVAENLLYGSIAEDLRSGDAALNRFADNTLLVFQSEDAIAEEDGLLPGLTPVDAGPRTTGPGDEELPAAEGAASPGAARHSSGWSLWDVALWAGAAALVVTLLLINADPRARR